MNELVFDRASHTTDAIQRAAYRFSDRLVLDLVTEAASYRCRISARNPSDELSLDVVNDFRVEVLDQVLRERIRAETAPLRNAILALAFSQTEIVEP
jgi:His-Xaa-Ser system protein HxsD